MKFALLILISVSHAFAFTGFPRLASYNSPVTPVSLSPVPISVTTNSTRYVTNSDFFYSEVIAASGTFGDVWTATNINGVSRVLSGGGETVIVGNVVTYVSTGTNSNTFVVADIVSGVESGTTFTKSTTFTTAQTTNTYFSGYVVGSLGHHIYTNIIARTNGASINLWSVYPHTIATKNTFARNPNCLLAGISNLTAISQCNEFQGSRGQTPVTALTRRHGYYRGHGAGVDYGGTSVTNWVGLESKEVIFVGHDNTVVTMLVSNRITVYSGGYDYSILIFTTDLPASITPMKVATNVGFLSPSLYPFFPTNSQLGIALPRPMIYTEQGGNVDTSGWATGIPGFTYNFWKGGDSGSPDMLLVGEDLLFTKGRSTSGPSAHMQGAMDALSTLSGLTPASYQMAWKDMSAFPTY